MTYIVTTPLAGNPVLSDVDTTQRLPLGTIVTAYDQTHGGGEFMYVSFPASTAVSAGSIMVWDGAYSAVVMPTSSASTGRKLGVCITAVSSSTSVQYGWVQISGTAAVLKTAVAVSPAVGIFVSGTAGRFYVTSSTGKMLMGMRTANTATIASGTSTVLVTFNRPNVTGT